jgi:hypothetical protein
MPTLTGIVSSLRSAWADINPLGQGMSFSTHEFLEDRVHELEQEILRLRRELAEAQAALAPDRPGEECACPAG